jgi:hypothetical protein
MDQKNNQMNSKYRFDLFGPVAPAGYRWVKKGELFKKEDVFFNYGNFTKTFIENNRYWNFLSPSSIEYPQSDGSGYLRKL